MDRGRKGYRNVGKRRSTVPRVKYNDHFTMTRGRGRNSYSSRSYDNSSSGEENKPTQDPTSPEKIDSKDDERQGSVSVDEQ